MAQQIPGVVHEVAFPSFQAGEAVYSLPNTILQSNHDKGMRLTTFGSLDHYIKGAVEIIDDDPRNYAFSNVFEVAATSSAYEKVVVGKNVRYVIEALRAEGTSDWFAAPHDEFALVMDGIVEVDLVKLDSIEGAIGLGTGGSVRIPDMPVGRKMGLMKLNRGHQALLPRGAAYRFRAATPGVILLQTILGPHSVQRWSEICYT